MRSWTRGGFRGKKIFPFILLLLFLACTNSNNTSTNFQSKILEISEEAEIRLYGSSPDIKDLQSEIDKITKALSVKVKNINSPIEIIEIINNYIYSELSIIPDTLNTNFENVSLFSLLRNRRGSCLGITELYLIISNALNLPIYAILLPGHIFLRYQTDSVIINIETLRYGINRSNEFYRDYFKVDSDNQNYFRCLSNKEVVGLFYFNLGNEYKNRELFDDAKMAYAKAKSCFPKLKEISENLEKVKGLF